MSNQSPSGSLDLVAIQDAIYNWVNSVCLGVLPDGGQIIWRNGSEPLPSRPCVTLKIIDGPTPVGRSGNVFLNGKNDPVKVGMQMEMSLSIQVFGNTEIHGPMAHQLCVDINSSLLDPEVLIGLSHAGIGIQGVGAPKNLTALEETEYEERAGIDIAMGVAQNITSKLPPIKTVNFKETVDGESTNQTVILP